MKKLLLMAFLSLPIGLFAQSYQLNLQGTRQIGKGSTGMAQPTDATALFTNPGSATFLKENDITGGLTVALSQGKFTDGSTNVESKTDNPNKTPFNLAATFGNPEGNWRFGLAVYTPFGLTNAWEKDAETRFEASKMSLLSVSVQPTASYKITEKLGIGAGFIYTYGRVDIRRDLPVNFQNGDFGESQLKGTAYGFGVNAGLYYEASEKVSLALTYRSSMTMKADDSDAYFNVPGSLESSFPDQNFEAKLPLPQIFGVGATYRPTEEWVLNGEVFLSDWHKYDTINVHFKDAPVNGEDGIDLVRNYHQGYSFRVGAEYLPLDKDYELRAGIMHNRTPIAKDMINPDVPDANRMAFSVGGSYKFSQKLRADLSLLYEPIHRKGTNKLTDLNGTYNYDLLFPSIGLTYKY